ncbi:ABC transporter permease [Endozoicomonas atrinae]|uniref:ABC transporter permease n=1 Tax=Endozoicomonas atrinae TaxID=1333660 RepID=UPI003B003D63
MVKNTLLSFLSIMIGCMVWELAISMSNDTLLPGPYAVLKALVELLVSADFSRHVCCSLIIFFSGWFIGIFCGVITGIFLGFFEYAYRLGVPWIALLFPIPKIALLPVFIILLGVGEGARIATIASGVFFPAAFCILQGVRSVSPKLIEMGTVFGLTRVQQLYKIVIPSTVPSLFLACRLTTAIALILLVSAEMIGANYGIGAFILGAGAMALMDQMLAGVLVLSLFGLMLFGLWTALEKKVLYWQE